MARSRRTAAWLAAAALAVLAAATCPAQEPPPLVGLQPITQGLLRPQGLEITDPPPAGSWVVAVSVGYGNTYSSTHHIPDVHLLVDGDRNPLSRAAFDLARRLWPADTFFYLDAEVVRTDLEAVVSPRRRLSAGIDVPWLRWGGTGLDTLADHVHSLIGTTHGSRPDFPYGETRIVIARRGRPFYLDRPPGDGLGDVSAWVAFDLGRAAGWRHRVILDVKAPTAATAVLGGDGWDWGLRWAAARRLGVFHLSGGLGWTHLGSGVPTLPGATDTWHGWFATGLSVWRWMDIDAIIRVDTSPYWHEAPGQLHKAALEMAIGPTFHLDGGLDLQAALGENIPAVGIAPDFSIQLRLVWRVTR